MLEARLVGFAGLGDLRVTTADRRGRLIDATVFVRREGSRSWSRYGTRGGRVQIGRLATGRYVLKATSLVSGLVAPQKTVWHGGGEIAVTLGLAPPAPPAGRRPLKCRQVCEGLAGFGDTACVYVDFKTFTQALWTTGYLAHDKQRWDEEVELAVEDWARRHADRDFGLFGVQVDPVGASGLVSVCPAEVWTILSAEVVGQAAGQATARQPPQPVFAAEPPQLPAPQPALPPALPSAPAPRRRASEPGVGGVLLVSSLLGLGAWWLGRE